MTLRDVYDAHFQFVWRSLRRLGVQESDVGDAVQEVFLVVHRRLAEFEGRAKVTTWLYRICIRIASARRRIAHARREIPHATYDLDCLAVCEPDPRPDLALLESLLEPLEIDQRAVFTLFELEGRSGPEIAELLDTPLPTVYSRLRLAREAFERAAQRHQARERRIDREVAR